MNQRAEQLIKSYVPMSEPGFLLLMSLTSPRHGYGIMQCVQELTGGRVSMGASTVYTILYKMEQDGLIEVCSVMDRRKVYRITPLGEEVLSAEAQRVAELASLASKMIRRLPLALGG